MGRPAAQKSVCAHLVVILLLAGCNSADPAAEQPEDLERVQFLDKAVDTGLVFAHRNGSTGEFHLPEIMGSGAALFDADGDNDLDIYLVQSHVEPDSGSQFFRNRLTDDGELRFVNRTQSAGIDCSGFGMGIAAGDYDGDGDVDLYQTNDGENCLLRNKGDGTFENVTLAAGVSDDRWSTSSAFVDIDADGWLDLYVANYVDYRRRYPRYCRTADGARDYCGPGNFAGVSDRVFRNLGNGTFSDVSSDWGLLGTRRAGLGVVTGDFDNNGRIDLYVANDQQRNLLLIWSAGRLEDIALHSGVAVNADGRSEASMGLVAVDLDYDGDEDIISTHLRRETNTVYINDGTGLFSDQSMSTGLGGPSIGLTGFGAVADDFDNDGWTDIVVANGAVTVVESLALLGSEFPYGQPNQLLLGSPSGVFSVTTPARAGPTLGLNRTSRGLTAGDVDNDGDMDLVVANNGDVAELLINQSTNNHSWITLRATEHHHDKTRDVLGASVRLIGLERTMDRRVRTDGSYASAMDPRVHFGLGDYTDPVSVQILWPDGSVEIWSDLATRQHHELRRGTGAAASVR